MKRTGEKRGGFGRKLTSIVAAVVMAMTMTLGTSVSALALDAGGLTPGVSKGSVIVHKLKTDTASTTVGQGTEITDTSGLGTPLAGCTFDLYQLDTAKVEGSVAGTDAATAAPAATGVSAFVTTYAANATPTEITTDANGLANFTGLNLGYYLLVEKASTDTSVDMAAPAIITIPFKTTDGTYLSDVNVYPKNVSTKPVVKKVENPTGKVLGENDVVSYDIYTMLGATSATDIVNGSNYMTMKITDSPDYATVGTNKFSALTMQSWTAKVIYKDGTTADLDSGTTAAAASTNGYFTVAAVDGTTATPNITWDLTTAGATKLESLWNSANPIQKIEIIPTFKVNSYVTKLATEQGLENKAELNSTGSGGTTLATGTDITDPIPTGAFDFLKMQFASDTNVASALANVTWNVASSEANANAGQYLKDGTASLTWTSDSTGKVAPSGLVSTTLKDGSADYTAVKDTYAAALAAPGVAKTVDLWLVETTPTGFQALAPQKVTLTITYDAASNTYTTTAAGGNVKTTAGYYTSAQGLITGASASFGIMNAKIGQTVPGSFALPNTGGMGAILFVVIGTLLIAAGCFYFLRRRSHDQN